MSLRIVIVGGGVMGAAAAFFLARRGARVCVVERDPTYARASSALSASGIRQQFSTPACIAMSRFSFEFLRRVEAHLGLPDSPADVGLVERGYLTLATEATAAQLRASTTGQTAHGASTRLLDRSELTARFPWLNVDDLACGAWGEACEGWFDGYSLLQAFRRASQAAGARWVTAEATDFVWRGGRLAGVRTSAGAIPAEVVVDAAGWRAGEVAGWAGLSLPIAPERRCVYAFECRHAPPDLPLIVDPAGVYVRPEGQLFICGGPALPNPGAEPSFEVDPEQFETVIWPALAHRAPAFERLRLVRGWAGQYDANIFDHNALIGWADSVPGLFLLAGFSGHGMQHAPAAGIATAELILDGAASSVDVQALDPRRLAEGRPLRELNVI